MERHGGARSKRSAGQATLLPPLPHATRPRQRRAAGRNERPILIRDVLYCQRARPPGGGDPCGTARTRGTASKASAATLVADALKSPSGGGASKPRAAACTARLIMAGVMRGAHI